MDIDQTISQQEDHNPEIQFEECPHCSRHFFQGKLQLHLKLCTPESPMLLSPKRTHSPSTHFLSTKSTYCPHCHTKFPAFLFSIHAQKCIEAKNSFPHQAQQMLKESPKDTKQQSIVSKYNAKQITLPLIQKVRQNSERTKGQIVKEVYRVRVREQLRCLRLAQQVQKVECPYCRRMFSKEAALRHVPICEKLRQQEKFISALKIGKGDRRSDSKSNSYLQKSIEAVQKSYWRLNSSKLKSQKQSDEKCKGKKQVHKAGI